MYPNKGYANGGGSSRPKRERKLSILFKHSDPAQHCAGVESLVVAPDGNQLFSASRDSTVKRWSLADAAQPTHEATFEDHTDWVNDILLFQDFLVSCSNDKTVKLWRPGSNGDVSVFHTFHYHTDYVTCLAASPHKGLVYSGGLRSEVFSYDMQHEKVSTVYPQPKQAAPQIGSPPKEHGSVYAMAASGTGNHLALGTTHSLIRIIDPRTNQKGPKLRGHTDNVRALAMNEEGSLLLSASSDHTLRLWDIGQQRCIQVHQCHSDSVWALAASPDFKTVYSGGRDCCIFRTSLQHRTCDLAYRTTHPVTSLAYIHQMNAMWVATTDSSITGWTLPLPNQSATSLLDRRSLSGLRTTPSGRMKQSAELRQPGYVEPMVGRPSVTIQGAPAIVEHRVLNDRRYVLTRNAEGHVTLWDVLTALPAEHYGRVDIAAKERELRRPMAIPSWYSCDHRLGQLLLHLEPPACFGAEVYAASLGWLNVQDDYKLNYGTMVLRAALRFWARRHLHPNNDGPLPGELDGGSNSNSLPEYAPRQVAVIGSNIEGRPWRRLVGSFNGTEAEGGALPTWAVDVLLHRKSDLQTPRELKTAFILQPAEGSNLPSLLQSRLNAPRILEVRKVASYCQTRLADQRIEVEQHFVSWNPQASQPPPQNANVLELTCNGYLVPYDVSISAVKKFIWKRSDDVIFNYKIRDPNNPAPMAVMLPPS